RRLQEHHRCVEHLHRSGNLQRRVCDRKMKRARGAAGLVGLAMLFGLVNVDLAQPPPPGYPRPPAQSQLPVQRALPVDETPPSPPPAAESEQQEKRQLEYANALFTR